MPFTLAYLSILRNPNAYMALDVIARQHGTDKSTLKHGFTEVYEELLHDRRRQPIAVLEIGVYKGAGLRMWRDYLPNARVIGIDINKKAERHAGERIGIYIGDQSDQAFLDEVVDAEGPFDLVIDDGGHRAIQQKTSLRNLWDHVNPGGVYAIEDIHTSYYRDTGFGMGWREPETTVEFLKYIIDDIHHKFHGQAVVLPGIQSLHFYSELCIIQRSRG